MISINLDNMTITPDQDWWPELAISRVRSSSHKYTLSYMFSHSPVKKFGGVRCVTMSDLHVC